MQPAHRLHALHMRDACNPPMRLPLPRRTVSGCSASASTTLTINDNVFVDTSALDAGATAWQMCTNTAPAIYTYRVRRAAAARIAGVGACAGRCLASSLSRLPAPLACAPPHPDPGRPLPTSTPPQGTFGLAGIINSNISLPANCSVATPAAPALSPLGNGMWSFQCVRANETSAATRTFTFVGGARLPDRV